MNVSPLYLLFFAFLGVSTLAAAQSCPYPSAVRYVDGHFQGTDSDSPWISQAMSGGEFVETFVGALFTPSEQDERKHGYLEKCIYKTLRGKTVTLRYGTAQAGGRCRWQIPRIGYRAPMLSGNRFSSATTTNPIIVPSRSRAKKRRRTLNSQTGPPADAALPRPCGSAPAPRPRGSS